MSLKTIVFLIDTLEVGGAERSLLDITSRFTRYRPVVVQIYPGESLKKAYEAQGIEVISLNVPLPYHWKEAVRAVDAVVKKLRPAILHSTLFKSDIIARRVARRNAIPLVNSLVNNSYHESRFRQAGLLLKVKLKAIQWLDAFTARRVDRFISNSEAIAASNREALGLPPEKIRVIYRGREVSRFSRTDEHHLETLKAELNGTGKRIFLNVSRLLYRKGQRELIRSFRQVHDQLPDTLLLIAGEGPFRPELEAEIRAQGLEGAVTLLGSRNDVPSLLHVADRFVFPSHYEGLPGALIEAMLARVPVIASATPENRECVDAQSALFFNTGDEKALTEQMIRSLHDPEAAQAMAERAYGIACVKFDIQEVVACYENLYDELLSCA